MKSYRKILDRLSKDIISIDELKFTWIDVFWVFLLSLVFFLFFLAIGSVAKFNLLVVPAVLIGYYKYNQLTQLQQKLVIDLTIAVIITCIIRTGLVVYESILQPPQWDFHLYWVYGQAGARLLNPYEPGILLQFAQALNPSEALLNELYFFQLPPLIFLFLPLGWFEINTAAFLWYIFLLIVLILDIRLLWSIFYGRADYKSLLFVALLILALPPTIGNFVNAQINFIVLLAFLLYWQRRESFIGGVWLGIGMIVKPILIIVLIYPVLRRHWRSLLGVIIAIIVSSAITVIVFGPMMFLGYFADNPIVHNMPNYLYTEIGNQSLLATILRLTNFDFSHGSPYLQPMFIVTAMLLTGITSFLALHRKDEEKTYSDYTLALIITLALLIFPKTLTHYAVFLIVPILTIWANHNKEAGISSWLILMFITIEYALVGREGISVFISILIAWLSVAGICIKLLMLRPHKQIMN